MWVESSQLIVRSRSLNWSEWLCSSSSTQWSGCNGYKPTGGKDYHWIMTWISPFLTQRYLSISDSLGFIRIASKVWSAVFYVPQKKVRHASLERCILHLFLVLHADTQEMMCLKATNTYLYANVNHQGDFLSLLWFSSPCLRVISYYYTIPQKGTIFLWVLIAN